MHLANDWWILAPMVPLLGWWSWYWATHGAAEAEARKVGWGPGHVREAMKTQPDYKLATIAFWIVWVVASMAFLFALGLPPGSWVRSMAPVIFIILASPATWFIRRVAKRAAEEVNRQAA